MYLYKDIENEDLIPLVLDDQDHISFLISPIDMEEDNCDCHFYFMIYEVTSWDIDFTPLSIEAYCYGSASDEGIFKLSFGNEDGNEMDEVSTITVNGQKGIDEHIEVLMNLRCWVCNYFGDNYNEYI